MNEEPDWFYAPKWANFVAQDSNGHWYWFEHEPSVCEQDREWQVDWLAYRGASRSDMVYWDATDWRESLQARPK